MDTLAIGIGVCLIILAAVVSGLELVYYAVRGIFRKEH